MSSSDGSEESTYDPAEARGDGDPVVQVPRVLSAPHPRDGFTVHHRSFPGLRRDFYCTYPGCREPNDARYKVVAFLDFVDPDEDPGNLAAGADDLPPGAPSGFGAVGDSLLRPSRIDTGHWGVPHIRVREETWMRRIAWCNTHLGEVYFHIAVAEGADRGIRPSADSFDSPPTREQFRRLGRVLWDYWRSNTGGNMEGHWPASPLDLNRGGRVFFDMYAEPISW